MESTTIFALSVPLLGAVHLLFKAVEHFNKGLYKTSNLREKSADDYCFFKTSDLLGPDSDNGETINNRQSSQAKESENIEQRRRQQAKRPRLYV